MAEPTNEEKIRQLEEMKEKLSEANEFEAERIKQLEAQEAILEKILKTQEDISNLGKKQEKTQEKITEELEHQQRLEEKIAELEKQKQETQFKGRNKAAQQRAFEYKQNEKIKAIEEQIEASKRKQAKLEKQKGEEASDALKRQNKLLKEQQKLEKELERKRKEAPADAKKQEEAMKKMASAAASKLPGGSFINQLMGAKDMFKGAGKSLEAMGKSIGGANGARFQQLAGHMKGISSAAAASALAMGVFLKVLFDVALRLEVVSKELNAATGYMHDFRQELLDGAKAGNMAGIGFKELGDSFKALSSNLSTFLPQNSELNKYMALTNSRLAKFGVSGEQSAQVMDHMQRAMGLSGKQAADLTANIARMGKEVGITAVKAINDFTKAQSRLAIYGKQNIQVFKELQAQAKATGMSIDSLVGSVGQFDKFDTAAESAAGLNAVLGTQLSVLELMNATDSERIMMVKQQVQASVGNFDSLDKFTKMHIAQAMGLKSVDEAQRVLNMSTAEYQATLAGQQESANIQQELADATEKLVPFMQKLKLAGMQLLLVFGPMIEVFSGIITVLSSIVGFFGDLLAGMGLLTEGGGILNGILGTIGIAFIAAKIAALAFGVTMGSVFWPITLIVGGLYALYEIFHKSGSPMLYQMFDFIAGAVSRMAAAFFHPITMIQNMANAFTGMFRALHGQEAEQSFDMTAVAKIDMDKVAGGISKVKSALMELSTIQIDGFLAMNTDGNSTSMIMGSEGVLKNISEGKLTVDVKMPDLKIPDVFVKVFVGDTELKTLIRTEVSAQVGAAG